MPGITQLSNVDLVTPDDFDLRTILEKLRWLVAVQEKLRLEHNAEGQRFADIEEFRKRQQDYWLPRMQRIGEEIVKLRMQLPMPKPTPEDPEPVRYPRADVRQSLQKQELDVIDLDGTFKGKTPTDVLR